MDENNKFMTRYSLFFSFVVLISSVFIFYVFLSSFETTYDPDYNVRNSSLYLLPEGWGFFTRNPREAVVDIYSIEGQNKLTLLSHPNGSAQYYFGASRLGRRFGYEISMVLNHIDDTNWKYFRSGNFTDSLNDVGEITIKRSSIENIAYISKGKYLLVYFDPIPWPFSRHPERFKRKWGLVKVTIT